jgi:hypothetical protein
LPGKAGTPIVIICKDIAALVDPYVVAFDMPLNEVALEMAKRHIDPPSFFIMKNSPASCRQRISVVFWRRYSSLNFHLAPEMTRHNAHEV